jgi:uncharacterized protein YbjQ (UPF0145 family)
MNKQIVITKVVSKNFVMDFVAKIQNAFGFNLGGYEKMIQKGVQQIQDELKEKNIKLKWFRYEITQLTRAATAIMFYGEKE